MIRRALFSLLFVLPLAIMAQMPQSPLMDPNEAMKWYNDKTPLTNVELNGVIQMLERISNYSQAELAAMRNAGGANSAAGMVWSQKVLGDIRASGFASPDKWAHSNFRVFRAYAMASNPDMKQQLADTKAQLAAMPAEQRAMMQQALSQMEMLTNVPDSDIALVRPHQSRLEALMAKIDALDGNRDED